MLHFKITTKTAFDLYPRMTSGVARGSKWGHAPRGAGFRGASAHFLQSYKNAFKAEI